MDESCVIHSRPGAFSMPHRVRDRVMSWPNHMVGFGWGEGLRVTSLVPMAGLVLASGLTSDGGDPALGHRGRREDDGAELAEPGDQEVVLGGRAVERGAVRGRAVGHDVAFHLKTKNGRKNVKLAQYRPILSANRRR